MSPITGFWNLPLKVVRTILLQGTVMTSHSQNTRGPRSLAPKSIGNYSSSVSAMHSPIPMFTVLKVLLTRTTTAEECVNLRASSVKFISLSK